MYNKKEKRIIIIKGIIFQQWDDRYLVKYPPLRPAACVIINAREILYFTGYISILK